MTEQSSPAPAKKTSATPLHLLLAFILGLGFVFLVFRGGWSLGLFLAVLLTEAVFLGWLLLPWRGSPLPGESEKRKAALPVQIVLAAAIIDLGLCMFLYDNIPLKILNVLALLVLCPVQYLLASRVFNRDWDQPLFWLEAVVSFFVRPFSRLGAFAQTLQSLFRRKNFDDSTEPAKHTAGKVLLGLLLAVPVLLISGSLLAASDQVFAQITGQFWQQLSLNELIIQIAVALVLMPFIFSFLYSGRSQENLLFQSGLSAAGAPPKTKGLRIDKTILISFLTCINLLYLVFAAIQITYLTGAFQAVLPADLTYSEYARSGFFELLGVSLINLILILLTVKGSDRHSAAGVVLRIESLLLIAGSLVQWSSAMFRMKMYVDSYGLTLLRFWVTAFMLLILAIFLLLLAKEFASGFPLFKSCAAAIILSLLLLNHVNSDAWIARYNINLYQATGRLDTAHFNELSDAAVPAMLELIDLSDPVAAAEISSQLISRYQYLEGYAGEHWQQLNVSQEAARGMIENRYDAINMTIN